MPLNATCNPSSGPAPDSAGFDIEVSGAVGSTTCEAAESPPNPEPLPDMDITPKSNGDWHVEITGAVDPDTEIFFLVKDQDDQVAEPAFHANPPS